MIGFDFTGGALPAGATLTRASVGTRFNSAGLLVSAAANTARFDHDPATLALRGLLIEAAATNYINSVGAIVGSNSTIANDVAADLSGAMTADKIVPDSSNSDHNAGSGLFQTVSGNICFSFVVKASGYTRAGVRGYDGVAQVVYGTFDLATGSVVPGRSGMTITPLGQDRFLVSASGTTLGIGGLELQALPADGFVQTAFVGNGASGVIVSDLQVEAGLLPTSRIPTSGAPATRAADTVLLDWSSKGVTGDAVMVRYTFDDLSTQTRTEALVAGKSTVPTTLDRRYLRSAALLRLAATPPHRRVTLAGTGSRAVTITA